MINKEKETGFLIQYTNLLGFQKLLVFYSNEALYINQWLSSITTNLGFDNEKDLQTPQVEEDPARSKSVPKSVDLLPRNPSVRVPTRSNSLPKHNESFFYALIPEKMNAFYQPKNDSQKRNSQLRDMANRLVLLSKKESRSSEISNTINVVASDVAEVEVENGLAKSGTLQRVQIVDATECEIVKPEQSLAHKLLIHKLRLRPQDDEIDEDEDFASFSPTEKIYRNISISSDKMF